MKPVEWFAMIKTYLNIYIFKQNRKMLNLKKKRPYVFVGYTYDQDKPSNHFAC